MNHSCAPNVACGFDSAKNMIEVNIFYIVIIAVVCSMVNKMMTVMLQVRAVQDVDVGEELQVLCLKDTSW